MYQARMYGIYAYGIFLFACQLLSLYFNFGVLPYLRQRYIGDMSLVPLSVALAYNNITITTFIVLVMFGMTFIVQQIWVVCVCKVKFDSHSVA